MLTLEAKLCTLALCAATACGGIGADDVGGTDGGSGSGSDPTHPPPSSVCTYSHASVVPAFCDSFDAPAGIGNRSGQLDGTIWGVSRGTGNTNLGGDLMLGWQYPDAIHCGDQVIPNPSEQIMICDGKLAEATNDHETVTSLAMYPKQPFDIAGRTGTVVFDMSDDTQGNHSAWPEFWYTDQPLPLPFTHEDSWVTVPHNALGIRFASTCAPGQGFNCGCKDNNPDYSVIGVDSAIVVRDSVSHDSFASSGADFTIKTLDCVRQSTGPGDMNHVELHIAHDKIEVWASDAGTTGPLKEIATLEGVNLSFSRGVIWLEDAHYNANKFNTERDHTFTWDNVGFDGPALARDLAFDVPDANVAAEGTINLGYRLRADEGIVGVDIRGVTGIDKAAGALLTLNYSPWDSATTVSYRLNGGDWHDVTIPPGTGGGSLLTTGEDIPLAQIVEGTNHIDFKTSSIAMVANIDIILRGAGD